MKKTNKAFFLFLCFITLPTIAAPLVESVAISGDKLIVTGHKFLDIDGLSLSDPKTGFKKDFKVQSATESEIIGTAVDFKKITVASLMNLIIDTAKGETTYPVSFSLQKDAVTNPTIKAGAITPDKFIGVTTSNPPDQTVLTWSQATQGFVFTKVSAGGGSIGVSEIVLGPGIIGAPNTASGSVPVSVDIGQTGDASKTKIPYFNSSNKIILDSTNSPTGALSGLSFKDGTQNFNIFNDNGLRIDSEAAADLLVLDVDGNLALKGPVTVGGFEVCLSNGNCIPSSGLTLVTATPPLVAAKTSTGTTNISAGAVNTANNLVQLDGTGTFPSTIPGVVRGPGSTARSAVSGNLAIFSDTTGEKLGDGGIGLQNLVSMTATPTTANKMVISTGANKALGTTTYTVPNTSGVTGQVLGITATNTTDWVDASGGVESFNGRTGAVTSLDGDYTASQVSNLPFGIITATDVQQAIDQLADLDSQKLPISGGTMTGTINTTTQNAIKIGPHATGTGEIQFVEPTAAGSNYVGFKASANIASNTVWTLPSSDGTSGQVLATNGSSGLSWTSPGGGGDVVGPSSSTSTNLATFNGTTGKLIQDSGISSNNLVTMSGTVSSTGNVIITGGGKIAQDSNTPLSNLPIMETPAISSNTIILSAGNSKNLISTPYTIPPIIGSATYVLKSDGTNVQWSADDAGTGDVTGPASSLDQAIPTFSGTSGKLLQGTLFKISGRQLNGPNVVIGENTAYGDYVACLSHIDFKDSYASPGFCQDSSGGAHMKGEGNLDFSLSGASKFFIDNTKTTNKQAFVNQGNFTVGTNILFVDTLTKSVGIGTTSPTNALQIDSTVSGFLPPRMTTAQKNLVGFPPQGLIVYDTDLGSLNVRNASGWVSLAGGTGDVVGPATATLNSVARYESGKVIKESGIIIDDANNISGINQLNGIVVNNLITGSGLVGNLPIFGLLPSELEDSGIASINIPTMASNATAAFHPILSGGANKSQIAAPYTLPNTTCLAGEVLKWNTTGFTCQVDFGGTGNVVGPATSSSNTLAQFSDSTGKIIKGTAWTVPTNIGALGQYLSVVGAQDLAWTSFPDTLVYVGGAPVVADNLPKFGGSDGTQIIDSGIATVNVPTMVAAAASSNTVILSNGADKTLKTTNYTIPSSIGSPSFVLKSDGANVQWAPDGAGTGDVVGPPTSTDKSIAIFSGVDGKLLANTSFNINGNALSGTSAFMGQNLLQGPDMGCFSHVNFKASFNDFGYCQSSTGKAFIGSGDSVYLYVNGFAKLVLDSSKTTHNQKFVQVGDFTVDTNTFFVNAATNSVGIGTATPTQVFQIDSTTSGFLPPRMSTAQKNAINPQTPGLVIFDTDLNSLSVRNASGWMPLGSGTGNVVGPATSTLNNFAAFSDGAGKIIKDSGINSGNLPTMATAATAANQIIISAGPGKQLTNTLYPIPAAIGASGTVLKSDGTNATWQLDNSGSGDVLGPASSTASNLASFNNTTGKLIQDSGVSSTNLVTMTSPAAGAGNILTSQGANKIAIDSDIIIDGSSNVTGMGTLNGRTIANFVDGPASATSTNLAAFNGITGKLIADSGVGAANVVTKDNNFSAANRLALSAGNNKKLSETGYTIPQAACSNGEVLKFTGGNLGCAPDTAGTGDVAGPATATLNSVARYESGKVIKESGIIIDDANNISGINQINGIVVSNLITGTGLVGNLPIFGILPSELEDSGIALTNIPTMASNATAQFHPILSGGANKSQIAAPYTLPNTTCLAGEVLKWNATGFTCQADFGGTGNVAGPATSSSNTLAQFSDSTGKIIKGTAWTVPNNIGFPGQYLSVVGGQDLGWTSFPTGLVYVGGAPVVADNLPKFGGTDGTQINDSGIAVINVPTMVAAAASSNTIILSNGADKNLKSTNYTIPASIGSANFVLKSDGTNATWQADAAGTGDVAGPATATLNSIARYESGKVIKESGVIIDDANNISGVAQLNTKVANNLVTGTGIGVGGNLPVYAGMSPTEIMDSGILLANIPTMASNATAQFHPILSAGNNKSQIAAPYTLPNTTCLSGEVLKWSTTGFTCQSDISGSGDVAGPATSTLNAISTWAVTNGKTLKNTAFTINGNYLQGANVVIGDNPGIGPGYACFSHKNFKDSFASAGFCQDASGNTFLNTGAAYTVDLKVGGQTEFLISNALTTNKQNFVNDGSFNSAGNMVIDTNTFFVDAATNSVGIGTITPTQIFQIDSTTKGFLPPRMTTVQKNAINPQTPGLVIFDSDLNSLSVRTSTGWISLADGTGDVIGPATSTVNNFATFSDGAGKIIKDSGINSGNLPTMVPATKANQIIISAGAGKQLTTTIYPIPTAIGATGTVLKSDGTNATWQPDSSGTGDVAGPATATLNSIARYESGKVIKESGIIIDDANNISGIAQLNGKVVNNLLTGSGLVGNLPVFGLLPSELDDSGIALINIPTMGTNATAGFQPILSGGNNKSQIAAPYTLPGTTCLAGEVLKWNATGFTCQSDLSGTGDVAGPATAALNSIARFESGKVIKESGITIDDANNISGVIQLNSKVANNLVTGTGIGVGRNLPIYVGMSPTEIVDSGISLDNIATMATNATAGFQPILSAGINKSQVAAPYTLPNTTCLPGEVLKWNTTGFTCQSDLGGSGAGDVAGPGTATVNSVALFADNTGKVLKTTDYTIPNIICPIGQVLKSDGTNLTCQADVNGLTEWVAGKDYKVGEIVNTGSDANWLFKVVQDHTSADVPADFRAGRIMAIAPPIITTGVQDGGAITLAGNVATVQGGTGYIAKYGTSPSAWPLITIVEWPTQTITLPSLGIYTLFIDESGGLIFQTGVSTVAAQDNTISVGIIDMTLGTAHDRKTYPTNPVGQLRGLAFFFGGMTRGLSYTPSVTKELARTAYDIYFWGANYVDPYSPNTKSYNAKNPVQFYEFTQFGPVLPSTAKTQLRQVWDNNGTLTVLGSSKWGFARIYSTLGEEDYIMYSQDDYGDEKDARAAAIDTSFITPPELALTKFSSWLVFKGGTDDFSDNPVTTCEPFGCDKIGSSAGGGVGGGDVLGPISSQDNSLAQFSGVNGKTIKSTPYTFPITSCPSGEVLKSDGINFICGLGTGLGDVVGPASSGTDTLASFDGTTGKLIKDSGIASAKIVTMDMPSIQLGNVLTTGGGNQISDSNIPVSNLPTMGSPAISANTLILSAGNSRDLKTTLFTIPPTIGSATFVLKSNGTNVEWAPDEGGVEGAGDVIGPVASTNNSVALFADNSGKVLKTTGYTIPNSVCLNGEVLKSDGTNLTCQAESNRLTEWVAGKAYKAGEIVNTGSDANWLFKVITDHTSVDVPADFRAGKIMAIAPPIITTGVQDGGSTSLVGNLATVQGGTGYIAKYGASPSAWPLITIVEWATQNIVLPLSGIHSLFIDQNGTLKSVSGIGARSAQDDNISVGIVDMNLGMAYDRQTYPTNPVGQLRGLAFFFGGMTKGLNYTGDGLELTRTAHEVYYWGADNSNPYDPNSKDEPAISPVSFYEFTRSGPVLPVARKITLRNNVYDNNGTLTTMANNRWGFVRIYRSLGADDYVMYSQDQYDSESEAKTAAISPTFIKPVDLELTKFSSWFVFQKSDSDFANNPITVCEPFGCDKIGSSAGGGGGAGDVLGPVASLDNSLAQFSGVNGKTIKSTPYTFPILSCLPGEILKSDGFNFVCGADLGGTGSGDVLGPVSSITNRLAIFADATGKVLAQSAFSLPTTAGTLNQTLVSNGDGTTKWGLFSTAGSGVLRSDRKLKKEIKNLTEGYIERLMDLRPVSFVWRDSLNPDTGFIAQDVSKIFPNLVENTDDGLGINYSKLVVPIVKAFQEKVQKDEQTIKMLLERIERLEKIIGKDAKK